MMKLRFVCVLLAFIKMVEPHLQRTIPPASEAGVCSCQSHPGILSGSTNNLFSSHRHNVKFILYTRSSNGDRGVPIVTGNAFTLHNSGFNPQLPLTVISHGWTEAQRDSIWMNPMKDALLSKSDMNIIIVDWSRLSRNLYNLAARYAKYTGRLLAEFLHFIKDNYEGFSGNQVHLIGFSMGAHVSGIAGHHFPGVARITGIDPAGPAFECISKSQRLDDSDASFVDVIHTNAGCRSRGHIGYRTPTGHQDFYVNGGGKQPGCPGFLQDAVADIATVGLHNLHVCHHHRALQYFTESIRSRETPYGFSCSDYKTFQTGDCIDNPKAVFGYGATPESRGVFFLTTQDESSFLSRHIKIEVYIGSGGNRVTQGRLTLQINGRNRGVTQETTLLSNNFRLRSNQAYISMLVIPLTTKVSEVGFILTYDPVGFQLSTSNNFLDILKVVAVDTSSKEEYCVSPRESILISSPYHLRPTLGSC